jgi:hypothetical protein
MNNNEAMGGYREDIMGYSQHDNRWQLDVSDYLNSLQLFLQGFYIDENGRTVKTATRGLMNEIGCSVVISMIMTNVNQHTIMSNLKAEQIRSTAMDLSEAIVDDLIDNYAEYGLDLNRIEGIVLMLFNQILNILTRAEAGKEREQRLTPRQTFVTPRYEEEQEKKRGFLGI